MSDPPAGEETPDQYFSERPRSRSVRRELRFVYRGELLSFAVDAGVFAAHGLDPGTALLIEHLRVPDRARVLDLGCGWGAVGVAVAKSAPHGTVVLTDVNRRAARLARENLGRNGIRNAEVRVGRSFEPVDGERFDVIAANPPFRAGRETVLALLSETPRHLTAGGRLYLVGKGSQGIRYYQQWLADHWGPGVSVVGRASGYRVLEVAAPPTSTAPLPEALMKPTKLLGLPSGGGSRPRARSRDREATQKGE